MTPRFDPVRHRRRSIRLPGYDYTSHGAYFITIVTQGRACLFGDVVGGKMMRNALGELVLDAWNDIQNHHPNASLDAFIVMPNHVHGVLVLTDPVGATPASPSPASPSPASPWPASPRPGGHDGRTIAGPSRGSVGAIIGSFKASTTRRLNALMRRDAGEGGAGEGGAGEGGAGEGDAGVAPTGSARPLPILPGGSLWQRNYYEHIV